MDDAQSILTTKMSDPPPPLPSPIIIILIDIHYMKSKSPGSMRFRLTCFSTSLLLLIKKRVDKNVLINLKLSAYFACFIAGPKGCTVL
jgi:hypothetical protein